MSVEAEPMTKERAALLLAENIRELHGKQDEHDEKGYYAYCDFDEEDWPCTLWRAAAVLSPANDQEEKQSDDR